MKKFKRGFLGPLGDDIPSIFPIVAGVLLFLGASLYVNNALDQKNADLQLKKAALELSYTAIEKGFIDADTFKTRCSERVRPTGNRNNVVFAMILKDCDTLKNKPSDPFAGKTVCASSVVDADKLSDKENQPENFVSFSYPISTYCENEKGLGTINVITWKKR